MSYFAPDPGSSVLSVVDISRYSGFLLSALPSHCPWATVASAVADLGWNGGYSCGYSSGLSPDSLASPTDVSGRLLIPGANILLLFILANGRAVFLWQGRVITSVLPGKYSSTCREVLEYLPTSTGVLQWKYWRSVTGIGTVRPQESGGLVAERLRAGTLFQAQYPYARPAVVLAEHLG